MSGRNNNGKSSVVVGSPSKEPRTTILSRNGREQASSSSGDVRNTGQKPAGKSNSTAVNGRSSDISTSGALDGGSSPSKQPTAILQPPSRSQGKGSFRTNESYGVVFSLKPNFGFIQPIYSDEQIYFAAKEYFDGIKVGDRVGYIVRSSSKGDYAEGLRHLIQSDVLLTGNRGLITRNVEAHRSGFGLIEIETASLPAENSRTLQSLGCTKQTSSASKASTEPSFQSIPFRLADVNSQQKGRRLDKGDYVEFSFAQVGANSSLLQALNIRLLQSKSERSVANQIQRMLDAGAVREMGSICSIKRVGEFGFIKSITRKDEIFFKLDDIVDQSAQVSEGTEVEFFVIAESNKGKLSDRAIHLKILPPGTVKFEVTIAKKVTATVVLNCETHPEESPGMLRLHAPISINKEIAGLEGTELKEVELWQRCLPEEFICKIGDVVTLDVHYYKPEKLFFARSVRIKCFRKLGRETGRVVAIKEHGFGFVHSASRSVDIYFKSTLVVGPSGAFVSESSLKMDSLVSFDVTVENTSSGGKFRAQRVMLEPGSSTDSKALLTDVLGIIIRNAKGNSPGLIRTSPERSNEIKDIKPFDPEVVQAITEFSELPQWKKLSIFGIPAASLRSYAGILEYGVVPGVIFDVTLIDDNDPGLGKVINIEKCPLEEYEAWLAAAKTKVKPKESESSKKKESSTAKDAIHFYKEDYITEDFGSIGNDLTVLFDVIWDSGKGRHVAKNIRMTDEPVLTSDGNVAEKQPGVLDVVVDKSGGKFGFIRCLESDEKLYWNLSASMLAAIRAAGKSSDSDVSIHVGREVLFSLRRRGGLRCAADIELAEEGSLSKEIESPFVCTGIVTEKQQLVLTDVSRNSLLNRKYMDLKLISELMANSREPKSVCDSKASGSTWEKVGVATSSKESQPIAAIPVSTLAPVPVPATSDPPTEATDEDGTMENNGDQDGVKDADENSEFRVEYKPKYFPCIPRKPVSLTGNAESTYPIGTVVNCLVSINWVLQRSPLHANIVSERIEQKGTQKALKKRGRIVRLKFRAKPIDAASITTPSGPAEELLLAYNVSSVDFVEICESEERAGKLSDSPSSAFYYCDVREIIVSDENGREKLQTGDELEFWCVQSIGNVAFSPTLVNKNTTDYAGIQFIKRPTVNTDLKLKEKSVIIMAKGPPNESAKGFETGWRSTYTASTSVDSLPWANLLTGTYVS